MNLSPRERAVMEALAKGYRYKEIAAQLEITFETVHSYVRNIFAKMKVTSRTEAVVKWITNPDGVEHTCPCCGQAMPRKP